MIQRLQEQNFNTDNCRERKKNKITRTNSKAIIYVSRTKNKQKVINLQTEKHINMFKLTN